MAKQIFLNLPVADLDRAVAFYEAIGAVKNPQFSDAMAACMVMSDALHIMLLTHDRFRMFSPKPIADRGTSEILICIAADSRAAVDGYVAGAEVGGGRLDPCPVQDHGCMYGRSFEDPDGHVWEVMWMDLAAMNAAMHADGRATA